MTLKPHPIYLRSALRLFQSTIFEAMFLKKNRSHVLCNFTNHHALPYYFIVALLFPQFSILVTPSLICTWGGSFLQCTNQTISNDIHRISILCHSYISSHVILNLCFLVTSHVHLSRICIPIVWRFYIIF